MRARGRAPRPRRRGAIYAIVVFTVAILTVAVLGAFDVQQRRQRAAQAGADAVEARRLALSSLEWSLTTLAADPFYRATLGASPTILADVPFSGAVIRVVASDPFDADIADDAADPIALTATVAFGAARQSVRASLRPVATPLDILASSLHAGGGITFSSATVRGPRPAWAGGIVFAASSSVQVPVFAGLLVSGSSYTAGTTSLAGTRTMPTGVIAAWRALGTAIPRSSLSGNTLERVVLSPGANPFGTANPRGIYFIDCGGEDVTIRFARIQGTLVLVNAGSGTRIIDEVLLEPAAPGNPVLLVDGDLLIDMTRNTFSEGTHSVNLNPSAAPWAGRSDNDRADSYPSKLGGLVYATDDLDIRGNVLAEGPLIAGDNIDVSGTLTTLPDPALAVLPPLGFRAGTVLTFERGSFVALVDP